MNIEEYQEKKQKIQEKKQKMQAKINVELRLLVKEFILSNNKIQKGALITDHVGTIKVERILAYEPFSKELPSCIFYGPRYTKKLKPYKNGSKKGIFQIKVIKKGAIK